MHNMATVADTMIAIRDKGFHFMTELESEIKRLSSCANQLRKEFKDKEFEQKRIKEITKHLQICSNKKLITMDIRKIQMMMRTENMW